MDKFTRNYSIGLGLICLAILVYWLATFSFRVSELNDLLENDQSLVDYPYQFRVISLDDGVAELSSPRSFDAPAVNFLAIIYPDLKNRSTEDPILIAAQKDLADHQAHAKKLILDQPDITKVRWVLDRAWYSERGIYLE